MTVVHCVALFLPNTIAFQDASEKKPSTAPTQAQVRNGSAINLPSRGSAASLFAAPTPPETPSTAAAEAVFGAPTTAVESRNTAKLGDSRSLVRNDADVPEWGLEPVFNQPRSRVGPPPSRSILEFGKLHEQASQKNSREVKKTRLSPLSRNSRKASAERGYESKSWTVEPAIQGNGGLINAVRSAADREGLEVSWIGTLGFPTDSLTRSTKAAIADCLVNEYQSEAVYVSDKDFDGCYAHYCKTILWPIFHYQVPDHPKSKAYADHSWEFYLKVNQAFADKVIDSYKRGDKIWVHDYHLLLVPNMIRERLPDAQIGFFLHTAFPSADIFRCLATVKCLLGGMLGANLVAFQTDEYAQHFLQTCSRLLTVETTDEGVQREDHFVNVVSQPIGIDPPALQKLRQTEGVQKWVTELLGLEKYKNKYLIVARDKLDNLHGVRQKLLAYELFLRKYPQWKEKVVMIQVATSTSAELELLTTVSDICSRIDLNANLTTQPLMFLKRDIDFQQYLALLTVADVLMISSLRDGMNLTAHEYIMCQDGTGSHKKHGPLILSEFTGSAVVFGNAQISINPWDYKQQAEGIKQALEMSEAEKENRWISMHSVVMNQTGSHWYEKLSHTLAKVHEEQHQRASSSIPRLSTTEISEKYKRAGRRVFLIDYEGTLAPHRTRPGIPLAFPWRIIDTLNDLMTDSKNVVYIMSGRCADELDDVFRAVTGLGMIAENGCFVKEYGATDWRTDVNLADVQKWKSEVKGILDYFRERMDGSYVEERRCSLLFRYEKVEDQERATCNAGHCADQINGSHLKTQFQAIPISKAVLIEPNGYTKATAAMSALAALHEKNYATGAQDVDFLMVAGDDREDECVFNWANEREKESAIRDVFTVSVGKRNTQAHATLLGGSTSLLTVLQKLAKISLDSVPEDYFSRPRPAHTAAA